MEIYKVKNYKTFAEELANKTGCDIKIQLQRDRDHIHHQLDKMGISLGVLCVNNGEISFAPFERFDTVKNEQYINAKYLTLFDDFKQLMKTFQEMFVE